MRSEQRIQELRDRIDRLSRKAESLNGELVRARQVLKEIEGNGDGREVRVRVIERAPEHLALDWTIFGLPRVDYVRADLVSRERESAELVERIRAVLDTEERGEALVGVAADAHAAELELALLTRRVNEISSIGYRLQEDVRVVTRFTGSDLVLKPGDALVDMLLQDFRAARFAKWSPSAQGGR